MADAGKMKRSDIVNLTGGVETDDGRTLYGMDAENYKKIKASEDPELERKVGEWIEDLLETKIEDTSDLYKSLKDGIVLVAVANKLSPGIIAKYNKRKDGKTKLHVLMERENINLYLDACWKLGVESGDMFVCSDLHSKKSIKSVIANISALSRIAPKFGIENKPIGPVQSKAYSGAKWDLSFVAPQHVGEIQFASESLEETILRLKRELDEANNRSKTMELTQEALRADVASAREKLRQFKAGGDISVLQGATDPNPTSSSTDTSLLEKQLQEERERSRQMLEEYEHVTKSMEESKAEILRLKEDNVRDKSKLAVAKTQVDDLSRIVQSIQESQKSSTYSLVQLQAKSSEKSEKKKRYSDIARSPRTPRTGVSASAGNTSPLSPFSPRTPRLGGSSSGTTTPSGKRGDREDLEYRVWMYEKMRELIHEIMTTETPLRTIIDDLEQFNAFGFDVGRRIFAYLLNQHIVDRGATDPEVEISHLAFKLLTELVNKALSEMEPENGADFISAKYFIHSAYCVFTRYKSTREKEADDRESRKEPRREDSLTKIQEEVQGEELPRLQVSTPEAEGKEERKDDKKYYLHETLKSCKTWETVRFWEEFFWDRVASKFPKWDEDSDNIVYDASQKLYLNNQISSCIQGMYTWGNIKLPDIITFVESVVDTLSLGNETKEELKKVVWKCEESPRTTRRHDNFFVPHSRDEYMRSLTRAKSQKLSADTGSLSRRKSTKNAKSPRAPGLTRSVSVVATRTRHTSKHGEEADSAQNARVGSKFRRSNDSLAKLKNSSNNSSAEDLAIKSDRDTDDEENLFAVDEGLPVTPKKDKLPVQVPSPESANLSTAPSIITSSPTSTDPSTPPIPIVSITQEPSNVSTVPPNLSSATSCTNETATTSTPLPKEETAQKTLQEHVSPPVDSTPPATTPATTADPVLSSVPDTQKPESATPASGATTAESQPGHDTQQQQSPPPQPEPTQPQPQSQLQPQAEPQPPAQALDSQSPPIQSESTQPQPQPQSQLQPQAESQPQSQSEPQVQSQPEPQAQPAESQLPAQSQPSEPASQPQSEPQVQSQPEPQAQAQPAESQPQPPALDAQPLPQPHPESQTPQPVQALDSQPQPSPAQAVDSQQIQQGQQVQTQPDQSPQQQKYVRPAVPLLPLKIQIEDEETKEILMMSYSSSDEEDGDEIEEGSFTGADTERETEDSLTDPFISGPPTPLSQESREQDSNSKAAGLLFQLAQEKSELMSKLQEQELKIGTIHEHQQKYEEIKTSLEQMREKFQVEIGQLNETNKVLQTKLLAERKEILKRDLRVQETEKSMKLLHSDHKREAEKLNKQIQSHEKMISNLKYEISQKTIAIQEKEKQISYLNFQSKRITELLKEREDQEKKLEKKLAEETETTAANKKALQDALDTLQDKETTLEAAEQELQSQEDVITQLRIQIRALEQASLSKPGAVLPVIPVKAPSTPAMIPPIPMPLPGAEPSNPTKLQEQLGEQQRTLVQMQHQLEEKDKTITALRKAETTLEKILKEKTAQLEIARAEIQANKGKWTDISSPEPSLSLSTSGKKGKSKGIEGEYLIANTEEEEDEENERRKKKSGKKSNDTNLGNDNDDEGVVVEVREVKDDKDQCFRGCVVV